MNLMAVIQARMSSRRFPGKVLAPFRSEPTIVHVLRAVEAVVGRQAIVVATSTDPSDDVLAGFLRGIGVAVVRGDLDNVLSRFQQAAAATDVEWILRIGADSPMLDAAVLRRVIDAAGTGSWDVVTTTFPRTFPKGRNAELVRRTSLMAIDAAAATPEEREHVTTFFYRRSGEYRILNVESGDAALANESLAVDTPDDLVRLEHMSEAALARYAAPRING